MPPTYLDSPPVRLKLGSKSSNKVSRLLPCEEISAYLSQIKRADERTRTAYPCSLRVIGHVLQGVARDCKCRIFRRLSLLRVAACCTVLRSRWYQSGIRRSDSYCLTVGPMACRRALRYHSSARGGQVEADGLFGVCMQ